MAKVRRIKTSCALSVTRKDNILKTIIELSHQEVKSVLLNGALKAFVDNIQPSDSTAVIGTQSNAQAPVQAPVETAESTQSTTHAPTQAPAQTPAQAPTQEVAYTLEKLQLAAAKLAREGKREELAAIIKAMGFTTIMDLKPEHYNAFAAKLREIGGVL